LVSLIKGAKTVTIYGYTETDTKSEAVKRANLILASNRCDTVMKYLKSKGIKAIFKTYGKGGVDPVSLTDQSKNRRVVIEANY
jgi:outer membrane protein OmpA-like peptidoglycan-associated protein